MTIMGHNIRKYHGDCFFENDEEFRFDLFTIIDSGYIVANVSGNCEYGPYKGEIRINLQEGVYHGEGLVTYSGISVYSFSLSLAINITESFCYISDGIWQEGGYEYHFQGELERISSE